MACMAIAMANVMALAIVCKPGVGHASLGTGPVNEQRFDDCQQQFSKLPGLHI